MAQLQSVTVPVSHMNEHMSQEPLDGESAVAGMTDHDEIVSDGSASSTVEISQNVNDDARSGMKDTVPQVASYTSVIADASVQNQSNTGGAVLANRRLILKQLPSGQFALTVQSLEPDSVGGSFVISNSQPADSSTCSVTVESSCEPDMSNKHSLLQSTDVNIASVEMCADSYPACLVCGDKGSGFHYSVFSCEGCKGFFKRTVQRNMVYSCKENGMCDINKVTRNSCQHCRFRRCLEAGMKKEAVREDRTPGGKHRAKKLRGEESDVTTMMMSGDTVMRDLNGCQQDDLPLLSRLIDSKPDAVNTVEEIQGIMSSAGTVVIKEFMQLIYLELRCIIEWAKKVPGFLELVSEDQMALLKSSFMELSILRLSYRSLDCVGSVRFCNLLVMSAIQCRNLGWGDDFVTCTLEFISRLRPIAIDYTEFCILCAVVLTYPDAGGLVDRQAVLTLHNTWLDLLQRYSLSRHPDDRRRCGRILLRLLSLRSISAKAADKFLSCAVDVDVKMTDIVQEMIS